MIFEIHRQKDRAQVSKLNGSGLRFLDSPVRTFSIFRVYYIEKELILANKDVTMSCLDLKKSKFDIFREGRQAIIKVKPLGHSATPIQFSKISYGKRAFLSSGFWAAEAKRECLQEMFTIVSYSLECKL